MITRKKFTALEDESFILAANDSVKDREDDLHKCSFRKLEKCIRKLQERAHLDKEGRVVLEIFRDELKHRISWGRRIH